MTDNVDAKFRDALKRIAEHNPRHTQQDLSAAWNWAKAIAKAALVLQAELPPPPIVWVVTGTCGAYSDRMVWVAKVFATEEDAKAWVEHMDAHGREAFKHYGRRMGKAAETAKAAMHLIDPQWDWDYDGPATYTAHPEGVEMSPAPLISPPLSEEVQSDHDKLVAAWERDTGRKGGTT